MIVAPPVDSRVLGSLRYPPAPSALDRATGDGDTIPDWLPCFARIHVHRNRAQDGSDRSAHCPETPGSIETIH